MSDGVVVHHNPLPMKGFRKFLLRGNLVDLAVAVVIGSLFGDLVKQFTASFISPVLALFGGAPNFNAYKFTINKQDFDYGAFITEVVYFVIVLPVARMLNHFERYEAASERPCPECTRSIPIQARRCPECTTVLT